MRATLPNPMDVPGVLSGLGLHPNEAVVLGELVRLLGARLVEEKPVQQLRVATPVGRPCETPVPQPSLFEGAA